MKPTIDLLSTRARKARFAKQIGLTGYRGLYACALLLSVVSVYCFVTGSHRLGYLTLALALPCYMAVIWYFRDLSILKPSPNPKSLDDVISANLLGQLKSPLTPKSVWQLARKLWPSAFIYNHLVLDSGLIENALSDKESDMPFIWEQALGLMNLEKADELGSGTLTVALILTSPALKNYLSSLNLKEDDVLQTYAWLERLQKYIRQPRPNFGGIGRDWAMGYAITLERYSSNISRIIEMGGSYAHFLSHNGVLDSIITNLDRGTPVALVGPPGVGKSQLIYGLAERLLEGKDPALQYYQIISLNAASIISEQTMQLEKLMLSLFSEAIHAGNVILFLDEAQLFFGSGVGAFNMSQLLLPVLQNHHLKVLAAFPPDQWQQLKATNESLAATFVSVLIKEPPAEDTLKILEDTALSLQSRDNIIITYQAIREAYRLSGQYMQELAYPGKAINSIEQAIPYANNHVLTEISVQTSFENTKGLKVSAAQAPEVDVLLHLEDRIHERMINQNHAVSIISGALRRGRAGVANPKRPVGSFLFLGPTGVGKTELARSLAATYFSSEQRMIRLDMSEYQRPEDVVRLLNTGQSAEKGLLTSIREEPFSVVLLDEVEKSNPQILNLLLQMLDEGMLTDQAGKPASFRSAIIIATSNAGSDDITATVKKGGSIEDLEEPLIDKLIRNGQFRAELINRFDEVVLFTPLGKDDLTKVARLMVSEVNKTLAAQNISVTLTDDALNDMVKSGYTPEFGARPMRRIIQKTVEDAVAEKILTGQAKSGSVISLDAKELEEHLKKNS